MGYGTSLKKKFAHIIASHTRVLLHQVVLLISKEDPVVRSLCKKLAKRMGCKVIRVGEEPLDDLKPLVRRMKLKWKDVAYMGKYGCWPLYYTLC